MGRRCGDLAINAGIADGAEMVITSEIGFDENKVIEVLKASKASDKKTCNRGYYRTYYRCT